MTIRLYDLCGRDPELRFSPYCWRAKLALAHKGLAFETVATPFTAVPKIDGVSKTVPVLDDDGRIVRDSFDIALHLEAEYRHRPPLFGHDGVLAAARFLEAWTMDSLHAMVSRMIAKDIHDVLDDPDQAYFRGSREARYGSTLEAYTQGVEAHAESFGKALGPVRRTLARHEWLGGSAPLFTDHIVLGSLLWLYAIDGRLPRQRDDAVMSWFERGLDLYGGLCRRAKVARAA